MVAAVRTGRARGVPWRRTIRLLDFWGARRGRGRNWRGWQPEQAPDRPLNEHDVERCPPGEVDHQPLDDAEIGTLHGANRRTGRDRSTSTPGGHQPRAV